ncbi:MAG TPA: FAD-dependent oxidoreductase [Devosia sp.]|nr:FAD-dependent oxidoreductase [Devosia sp.]
MSDPPMDFAILGATPQARLIAGLLAGVHGKSVAFVGESQSGFRLPRALDLSIAPLTRPESWALLQAGRQDVQKLMTRISGRKSWTRLDPMLFADSAEGQQALAHIRHMASGFGLAAERPRPDAMARGRDGILFRDATLIDRAVAEPALDRWMGQQGVRLCAPESNVTIHDDGSGEIRGDRGNISAVQCVLADDTALLSHLPAERWPHLLVQAHGTTILTEPTGRIAAPVMQEIDSGLTLWQRPEGGVVAFGPGRMDRVLEAANALLGGARALHRAGQSQYGIVTTRDGAPALGRIDGSGCDVLAGFGLTGIFLAPAIARWLAGVAAPQEDHWFSARLVNRSATPSVVADYFPAVEALP